MYKIDEKDYDFNFLIHFDMLKEVLIKLVRNQKELEKEITKIKKSNGERDKKINFLRKNLQIDESQTYDLINHNEEEKTEQKNEIEKNVSIEENKNKFPNINENQQTENIENSKRNQKNNDIENNEINNVSNMNNKITKQSDKNLKNNTNLNNSNIDENENLPAQENKFNLQINESIIKENNFRLNQIEMQLNNFFKKDFNNLKTFQKNHSLENESNFKLIDNKFNEIIEKQSEFDKKLEDCIIKCRSVDIINLIKDSDGSVDASKLLFKTLEDKCFKKFDFIDARNKKDGAELLKMKKNDENLNIKIDKVNRDIDSIKENINQQNEDILNNNQKNLDKNNEIISTINEKNKEINSQIEKIKNEINDSINLKEKKINEKINYLINGNNNDDQSFLKLTLGNVNNEEIQSIDKKITDTRKKLNDLESSFKIYINNNGTDEIRKEIKEIKLDLNKKLEKEDLKELYNYHLSDLDEINDINDQTNILSEELKKYAKDLQSLGYKIESINGNLILLQNNGNLNGGQIIEFSKYIDQNKLSENLKPIIKELEKMFKEINYIRRDISEHINTSNIIYEKKQKVELLQEELLNKINELKEFCKKKYSEKIETNKALKSLEIQIKSIDNKRTEGDGWLMAKQPIKCFNCASCEANIKNIDTKNEFLAWNKYPQGEKIYRMGQGFSHMLQMMTSEFIKTFEHNVFNSDNENFNNNKNNKNNNLSNNNSRFGISTMYNINNVNEKYEKSFSGMKINNKEILRDDIFGYIKKPKMKLPKMKKSIKKFQSKLDESVPISDEGRNLESDIEKINPIKTSPKIMKITKIKGNAPFNFNVTTPTSFNEFLNNKTRNENNTHTKGNKGSMSGAL